MNYFCCDESRRNNVLHSTFTYDGVEINGIEYLEVKDQQHQDVLFVHFLKPLTPGAIDEHRITMAGGERITNIQVLAATLQADQKVLMVTVSQPGDYATYALTIVGPDGKRLPWMDPILSTVHFSFKIDCPNDFDCDGCPACRPEAIVEPEIDYLAKDYTSFRQLMLDRLTALSPSWTERNAADLGVTLVELLAYVGDHLSYQQDAIATEGYLQTARQRVSVKRHARLVDYFMHDGCNARVFVQVHVNANGVQITAPGDAVDSVQCFTSVPGIDARVQPATVEHDKLLAAQPEIFENMEGGTFYVAHNEIRFHTWGDSQCCLPKGATSATLRGHLDTLQCCDVLVFEEVKGPRTNLAADADPSHRWAVRLTSVTFGDAGGDLEDPVLLDPDALAANPLSKARQKITEITWNDDDALPFPLCISSVTDAEHGSQPVNDVSVARGNIMLCDHGGTIVETLAASEVVPEPDPALALPNTSGCTCSDSGPTEVPARYRPRLAKAPLTQAATANRTAIVQGRRQRLPFDPNASASSVFVWDMQQVRAAIRLEDSFDGVWLPQRDLLSSDESALDFVAEVNDDGRATLRFGDDVNGARPAAPLRFAEFRYRIGNGVRGNVGAGSITHIVSADTGIDGVRNLLPARGGMDPESMEKVRKSAPYAFRIQQRAVTRDDYSEVTQRHAQVQRAATTVRWTGSWYTNFISVDRLGGRAVTPDFRQTITDHVEKFRMAGQDVEINAPHFVSLEIAFEVCLLPGYFRSHVLRALLDVFSNGLRSDGQRGLFHPDNFTFGQPVYLSPLIAAAQSVTGVHHVRFTKFQRQGIDETLSLKNEVIALDRLEIARLDNDPNFREHGVLTMTPVGGR